MKTMEFDFSWRRILSRLKSTRKKWLLTSAAVLIILLAFHFLFVTEKGVCSAVVSFSYRGVESGLDPDGNRFDETEMKSEELIRQAAETIGQGLSDEEVEQIREALRIQSDIPEDALERVSTNASIYGDNEISEVTEIEDAAYFPSRYSVTFRYKDAGFSAQRGTLFLEELLKAYEQRFYEEYGYNASAERVLSDVDYDSYDYVNAAEVLQDRLSLLRSYLARLTGQDNTRFVSKETGYSFSDLLSAVDTIQEEDVQWLSSYIISNNLTKDKPLLIDYYQYKIEDAERALTQLDARLFTLNELIASYTKTNAIFPSLGSAGSSEENSFLSAYEFSQPSDMYDGLINQKVDCQTNFSETEEQIAFYQRRIERLQNSESSGDPALVETRLEIIQTKIGKILQDVRLTAEEYFSTVELRRAVNAVMGPSPFLLTIISTIRGAVYSVLIAEAALFGLYILSALRPAPVRKRKFSSGNNSPRREATEYETAQ